ncbi:hypothetical protein NQZ68_007518 [Dissostichus eleginoides]|nr:hypothetical protein NQZ68_007518 [Dissostichus eleginoides]
MQLRHVQDEMSAKTSITKMREAPSPFTPAKEEFVQSLNGDEFSLSEIILSMLSHMFNPYPSVGTSLSFFFTECSLP